MNENTYLNLGGNNGVPMDNASNSAPVGTPSPSPQGQDPMMGGQQMPPAPDPMGGNMAPAPDPMGGGSAPADPMNGGMPPAPDPMGGGDPMGGSQQNGFDMGIGMTPDEDPKKFIEGGVAKIATELRKYQEGMPKPDIELDKTAVNTIAAATKTGLQPNQTDELMTSYADTMRKEGGEDNGGDNNFPDDMNSGDTGNDGNDMGMGDDMNMGDDMGQENTEQTPLQEAVNKAINELFRDINVDKRKSNKDNIQFQDSRDSFTRKPFMPPIK